MTVTGGDDLIKEIRGLLIEGQIAKFVHDEGGGLRIGLELADQREVSASLRRFRVEEAWRP